MRPPGRWQAARVGREPQELDGRATHLRTGDGDRVVSVLLKTRMESLTSTTARAALRLSAALAVSVCVLKHTDSTMQDAFQRLRLPEIRPIYIILVKYIRSGAEFAGDVSCTPLGRYSSTYRGLLHTHMIIHRKIKVKTCMPTPRPSDPPAGRSAVPPILHPGQGFDSENISDPRTGFPGRFA